MANVAVKSKKQARTGPVSARRDTSGRGRARAVSISDGERGEIEQPYEALRQAKARLISPDGESRPLPASVPAFLADLIAQLSHGQSVTIIRNQVTLTTLEAANMLGVSRQFLVNLLEKGEIAFHMVGTHRRVYAEDLLAYKAGRDKGRHKLLRDLAVAEAKEGLYERVPTSVDAR